MLDNKNEIHLFYQQNKGITYFLSECSIKGLENFKKYSTAVVSVISNGFPLGKNVSLYSATTFFSLQVIKNITKKSCFYLQTKDVKEIINKIFYKSKIVINVL